MGRVCPDEIKDNPFRVGPPPALGMALAACAPKPMPAP